MTILLKAWKKTIINILSHVNVAHMPTLVNCLRLSVQLAAICITRLMNRAQSQKTPHEDVLGLSYVRVIHHGIGWLFLLQWAGDTDFRGQTWPQGVPWSLLCASTEVGVLLGLPLLFVGREPALAHALHMPWNTEDSFQAFTAVTSKIRKDTRMYHCLFVHLWGYTATHWSMRYTPPVY